MAAETPHSRRWLTALVGLLGVLAAVAWWVNRDQTAPPQRPTELSSAELLEFDRSHQRALALLENKQYDESVVELKRLHDQFPESEPICRNLAIAQILPLLEEGGELDPHVNPEAFSDAAELAFTTLKRLQELAPESGTTWMLTGRLQARAGSEAEALQSFDRALEFADWDATIWFASGMTARDAGQPERELESLKQAFRLRPANLWTLSQLLTTQAQAQDSSIVATLQSARDLLQPFAEQIQQTIRFDVLSAVERSIEAAQTDDWQTVTLQTRLLGNVLRPQIATLIDQRRIRPDLMESIAQDSGLMADATADFTPPASIAVTFEWQAVAESPEDVRDVQVLDFDLDGKRDLLVLSSNAFTVLSRSGADEAAWSVLTSTPLPGGYERFQAADLDRDYVLEDESRVFADPDIVLSGESGVRFLRNDRADDGSRTLTAVDQPDQLPALVAVTALALVDFDHEGDLDIVVAADGRLHLWINRNGFQFADATGRSMLPQEAGPVHSLIPVDWNRDLAIDVLIGRTDAAPAILENILHGRLRWLPLTDDLPEVGPARAVDVLDCDMNGSWDLVWSTGSQTFAELTDTPDSGVIESLEQRSVTTDRGGQLTLIDYDNDGLRDLIQWDGDDIHVSRASGPGQFDSAKTVLPHPSGELTRLATADWDHDGDVDLAAVVDGRLQLARNGGGNTNHSMEVVTLAEFNPEQFPSHRVNMQGIGSLIELRVGEIYQAQVVRNQSTHFGLGGADTADLVRVIWTDGVPDNVIQPTPDQPLYAIQVLKGSCPYVYTWTGERFEFFTDCLWAAPIGLQFADGVVAQPREWEYLLIPSESLVARDGEYVLQLTEELWEAAYLDEVRLVAVDHPAEFEVFTNEKVGPPDLTTHRVRTVRDRRVPRSVRDQQGNDLLPRVQSRDGRFAQAFDRRLAQGLTPPQIIEIDLGPLPPEAQVSLFLTGWIFPTDTSLNVALGQDSEVESPRPPSLWVPDGTGGWRLALPTIGFPGGKTKTIAVDIGGELNPDDPRIQLRTTMELYWDEVFFTVNEPDEPVTLHSFTPHSADLHYRGFSARSPGLNGGPEHYDYQSVTTTSPWAPMNGRFTRYGAVTELLQSTDSQLVVLGAGDELTLRFRVPETPVPSGWKRDFLLYNVGWDKDADLNTVFGQTVEPLPAADMHSYPRPASANESDSSAQIEYLRRYQTREQSRRDFWKALLPNP